MIPHHMGFAVKKPKAQLASKREKVCRFMELRGITEWIEEKLGFYYKPVACVPDAPNFIELMNLDVKKEELMDLLIDICAGYWEKESELDEAIAILQSQVGRKLVDRTAQLSCSLNTAFDDYMKTKLDEKVQAFKRSTMQ